MSIQSVPAMAANETTPEERRDLWRTGTLTYDRKGLTRLFAWLLAGDFIWQMRERAVGPVVMVILKLFGASDAFVGLMMNSVPAALGMIAGPVLNTMSDNHRGPRGRRIPFMLVAIPFATVSLIGIAFDEPIAAALRSAAGAGVLSASASRLAVFALFWIVYEVAAIVSNNFYTLLVNDVVPHSVLGRFYGGFGMVGRLAAILFNTFMIGYAETLYCEMFVGLALIYGIGMYLMCLKVQEGEYPPPPPAAIGGRGHRLAAVKEYFRETFSIPLYRWWYASAILGTIASAGGAYQWYFAQSLGVDLKQYGILYTVVFAISFCTSFLWGYLADRFHPLRVSIVAAIVNWVITILCALYVRSAATFAAYLIVSGVLAGCSYIIGTPLLQAIFPRSRFGAFTSALGLLVGLVGAVSVPIFGAVLDATQHNYRLGYYFGAIMGAPSIALMLVFYSKFMALGGPKGYIPPE